MGPNIDSNPSGWQLEKKSFEDMNHYERGLELAQSGQYDQALEFMLEHLRTAGDSADVLNDTGAILHCLSRSNEAIEYFLKARNMQKDSAEILWNLVEALLADGKPAEAVNLFDEMEQMSIMNIDLLNRTANVFLKQQNKAGAIEMLIHSLEILPEQKILFPMIDVIRSKRPKVAFFCGGDGMDFLNEIYKFIEQRFEVRLFEGKSENELYELMQWSDISWFEWCTDFAVIASKKPKVCENIVRLHRYEAYLQWPQLIDWSNIDYLITVGNNFVKDALVCNVPDIENLTNIITIPNGVNLEKYHFVDRQRGKNIAFLSNLRMVKNPALILQGMQKLHYMDPEYRLFFAGHFQDMCLEQYMRHMVKALDLQDVVIFDGWQEDVNQWLADKHYIISTSTIESQGMGILEAMTCGLKPVIHNFPGAEQIFSSEYLFNISEEFCQQILSESYEPKKYRKFVEEKYPLKKQLNKISDIFNQLEKKIELNKGNGEISVLSAEIPEPV